MKLIQLLLLVILTLCGSAFMVFESFSYYITAYGTGNVYMAWATAIIPEVFQHALIITTGSSKAQGRLFKITALIIFVLTVFAAGYKIYRPMSQSIKNAERETRLSMLLERQIQNSLSDRGLYVESGQRTNTAISINRRAVAEGELKELIKNQGSDTVSLSEVIHLFVLRCMVQVSVLLFSWKIGILISVGGLISMDRKKAVPVPKKTDTPINQWRLLYQKRTADFIGILEYSDGTFTATDSKSIKTYGSLSEARDFFQGSSLLARIPKQSKPFVESIKIPKKPKQEKHEVDR